MDLLFLFMLNVFLISNSYSLPSSTSDWIKVNNEFCRQELMDDRKGVIDRCEWMLPNKLRNGMNDCINEIISYKRDERPIFCYLEEYKEEIETCLLMKLSQFYFEERVNQTTVQYIQYKYKECYSLSLSQLIPSTTTVLYYYDKKPVID